MENQNQTQEFEYVFQTMKSLKKFLKTTAVKYLRDENIADYYLTSVEVIPSNKTVFPLGINLSAGLYQDGATPDDYFVRLEDNESNYEMNENDQYLVEMVVNIAKFEQQHLPQASIKKEKVKAIPGDAHSLAVEAMEKLNEASALILQLQKLMSK